MPLGFMAYNATLEHMVWCVGYSRNCLIIILLCACELCPWTQAPRINEIFSLKGDLLYILQRGINYSGYLGGVFFLKPFYIGHVFLYQKLEENTSLKPLPAELSSFSQWVTTDLVNIAILTPLWQLHLSIYKEKDEFISGLAKSSMSPVSKKIVFLWGNSYWHLYV